MREADWFVAGAEQIAPQLLGDMFCVEMHDRKVARGRITETEAYVGEHDLACHAAKGRTPRTEVIYGSPGTAYVYFVYGMHHLFNIVCAPEDDPQAVLLRSVRWPEAVGRGDGPARLMKAVGITTEGHNRRAYGEGWWIEAGPDPTSTERGPRVGVDYAGEWAQAPLRFVASP